MVYYKHGGVPSGYTARDRIIRSARPAAETHGLGAMQEAMGDRYLGPVPRADLGGSLGSYFSGKGLGQYKFGDQEVGYSLGAAMLSDNEKTLVVVGVLGIVGWFFLGPKIKKAMK